METPDWVINPFSDIEEIGVVEEKLTELQKDIVLKASEAKV